MKKLKENFDLRLLSFVVLIIVSTLLSCSKTNTTTTTPTTTKAGFTWKENSDTTTHTADSSYLTSQYNTIIAQQKNGTTYKTVFEINLSASMAGTYTLNSTNVITFMVNNTFFIPTSGNVIITSNSAGKVSGTFQGSGAAAGGITSISGSFNDIPTK